MQGEIHVGPSVEKWDQDLREEFDRVARQAGDTQVSGAHRADFVNGMSDPVEAGENALHFVIQRRRLGCGDESTADSLKQRKSNIFFKVGNQCAYGRLRDAELVSRRGNQSGGEYDIKCLKIAAIHV